MEMKDSWKDLKEITEFTVEIRKDLVWAYDLLEKSAIGASNGMHNSFQHFKNAAQAAIKENEGDLTDEQGNILEAVKEFAEFQESWDDLERKMHTVRFQREKTVEKDQEEKEEHEDEEKAEAEEGEKEE